MLLIVTFLIALPAILYAASIYNSDTRPHKIKARLSGGEWIHTVIYDTGTRYFSCRFGCEIVVVETGSSIELESDEDIVIDEGELRVR
jgi:hypothetical protein